MTTTYAQIKALLLATYEAETAAYAAMMAVPADAFSAREAAQIAWTDAICDSKDAWHAAEAHAARIRATTI